MDTKTVWFGTEDDLVEVKCPSTELTRSRVSWRNSGTYLNGGGFATSSGTGHDEAAISWGADSVEGFSTLLTQLNKGEPLYYLDPLVCKTNLLPPYAAQFQPNNPFGFVAESATGANGYPSTAMKNLYTDRQIATVPVPEGYRLWVGCAGSSGGVYVDAPPPAWVEVARNLARDPGATGTRLVDYGGWSGSNENKKVKSVVDCDWSGSGKAVRQTFTEVGQPLAGDISVYIRDALAPSTVGTCVVRVAVNRTGLQLPVPATYSNNASVSVIDRSPLFVFDEIGEIATVWVTFESLAEPQQDLRLLFSFPDKRAGDYIELSDADIYEGEYDPDRPWFSGDHAPDGMRSEWLDEPNNSVSVLYEQEGDTSDPEIPAEQPNSSQRLTHYYPGGRSYSLFVQGGSVLQGVMAQILPEGQTPASGGFIPGMGFSALALQDNPQITEYSAVLENYQMAMTANFIEVGSWM